jgi:hypothetical protein
MSKRKVGMMNSEGERNDDELTAVVSLCRAVRQGVDLLSLDFESCTDLLHHLDIAELSANGDDRAVMIDQVKAIRYVLLEVADGPVAPFLADAAALIIGDGFGRIFS